MHSIVIEHVALEDLPPDWRARFPADAHSHVTVRIEVEVSVENPMFGIWQDREEMNDVDACLRRLRSARHPDQA